MKRDVYDNTVNFLAVFFEGISEPAEALLTCGSAVFIWALLFFVGVTCSC